MDVGPRVSTISKSMMEFRRLGNVCAWLPGCPGEPVQHDSNDVAVQSHVARKIPINGRKTVRGARALLHELHEKIVHLLASPTLFYLGFSIWLTNSFLESTYAWIFVPASVSKALRYVALGLVVLWSLCRSKSRLRVVPIYMAIAAAIYLCTRSTKFVKYSFVLLIPLGRLAGQEGLRSRSAWISLIGSSILVCSAANAESVALLDLGVLFLASQDVEFRSLASLALVLTSAFVAIVLVGASLGVLGNYILDPGVSGRMRYYLGFSYALYPARYLFLITCLVMYLERGKPSPVEVVALVIANTFVYKLVDARLAFYCAMMVLLVGCIVGRLRANLLDKKAVRVILIAAIPALAVIAVASAIVYDPDVEWMARLNAGGILGNRMSLANAALKSMGVPPLGQKVQFVGNALSATDEVSGAYNYVDIIYVQILVVYGPLVWLIIAGLQTMALKTALDNRDAVLAVILLTVAGQGIIDDAMLTINYNTFVLLGASAAAQIVDIVGKDHGPLKVLHGANGDANQVRLKGAQDAQGTWQQFEYE